jgi:hypothetical protein
MIHLPIFRVKQRKLEEYVTLVYRMRDFDFLKATGYTPGMIPEYQVTGTLPESYFARRQVDAIRRGDRVRDIPLILNTLAADGHIPPGKYLIDTHPEPPPIDLYTFLLRSTEDPLHPDCLAFKEEHKADRTFMEQSIHLDRACIAQRTVRDV